MPSLVNANILPNANSKQPLTSPVMAGYDTNFSNILSFAAVY